MIKFDKVKRFADADIELPRRKTEDSAGYDFVVAEDTIIPAYHNLNEILCSYIDRIYKEDSAISPMNLAEVKNITKATKCKPTLVPTGVKCAMEPGQYLEISMRSSSPLNYWLILANGVGIIDRDYWSNESNDGEIFFQVINLFPFDIIIKKGETIGQGIIKNYLKTNEDSSVDKRTGGFGSTDK